MKEEFKKDSKITDYVNIHNCKNDITIFNTKDWIEYTDVIESLISKQISSRPLKQGIRSEELTGICPNCKIWSVGYPEKYCSNCGQKLEWEGLK